MKPIWDLQNITIHLYYSTQGELYEYWYDAEDSLASVRHHSSHSNSKRHVNPYGHEGGKDDKGNNTESKKSYPVDPEFAPPSYDNQNNNKYEICKWGVAAFLAPCTGGGSFAVAILTP